MHSDPYFPWLASALLGVALIVAWRVTRGEPDDIEAAPAEPDALEPEPLEPAA